MSGNRRRDNALGIGLAGASKSLAPASPSRRETTTLLLPQTSSDLCVNDHECLRRRIRDRPDAHTRRAVPWSPGWWVAPSAWAPSPESASGIYVVGQAVAGVWSSAIAVVFLVALAIAWWLRATVRGFRRLDRTAPVAVPDQALTPQQAARIEHAEDVLGDLGFGSGSSDD